MATKVKGLFKGIKNNLTNIFEEKEGNDDIQIGFPTDVKHVAHIGLDGPSANTPTWMTTLNSSASEAPERLAIAAAAPAVNSTDTQANNNNTKGKAIRRIIEIPRTKPAKDTCLDSPTRRGSDEQKQTRRHRHTNTEPSSDSPTRGSTRHARRHGSTNQAGELSSEDKTEAAAATPKQHRRRKSKTANGDGSVKSSRRSSKGNSLSEISFTDMESGNATKRYESLV